MAQSAAPTKNSAPSPKNPSWMSRAFSAIKRALTSIWNRIRNLFSSSQAKNATDTKPLAQEPQVQHSEEQAEPVMNTEPSLSSELSAIREKANNRFQKLNTIVEEANSRLQADLQKSRQAYRAQPDPLVVKTSRDLEEKALKEQKKKEEKERLAKEAKEKQQAKDQAKYDEIMETAKWSQRTFEAREEREQQERIAAQDKEREAQSIKKKEALAAKKAENRATPQEIERTKAVAEMQLPAVPVTPLPSTPLKPLEKLLSIPVSGNEIQEAVQLQLQQIDELLKNPIIESNIIGSQLEASKTNILEESEKLLEGNPAHLNIFLKEATKSLTQYIDQAKLLIENQSSLTSQPPSISTAEQEESLEDRLKRVANKSVSLIRDEDIDPIVDEASKLVSSSVFSTFSASVQKGLNTQSIEQITLHKQNPNLDETQKLQRIKGEISSLAHWIQRARQVELQNKKAPEAPLPTVSTPVLVSLSLQEKEQEAAEATMQKLLKKEITSLPEVRLAAKIQLKKAATYQSNNEINNLVNNLENSLDSTLEKTTIPPQEMNDRFGFLKEDTLHLYNKIQTLLPKKVEAPQIEKPIEQNPQQAKQQADETRKLAKELISEAKTYLTRCIKFETSIAIQQLIRDINRADDAVKIKEDTLTLEKYVISIRELDTQLARLRTQAEEGIAQATLLIEHSSETTGTKVNTILEDLENASINLLILTSENLELVAKDIKKSIEELAIYAAQTPPATVAPLFAPAASPTPVTVSLSQNSNTKWAVRLRDKATKLDISKLPQENRDELQTIQRGLNAILDNLKEDPNRECDNILKKHERNLSNLSRMLQNNKIKP